MKKYLLLSFLLVGFNTSAAVKTIFKVSKSINTKNVLHYKVDYDKASCTFKSEVYAEWKMDEEDGRWKPLTKSSGMIKKPLMPTSSTPNDTEISFTTLSMSDFQLKGVLQSDDVKVFADKNSKGECIIRNLIQVDSIDLDLQLLHTKMNFFGSVSAVTIYANGYIDRKEFKKKVKL